MAGAIEAVQPLAPAAPQPTAPAVAPGAPAPLDDTAESTPDVAATLADEFSRRAEMLLLVEQSATAQAQLRLDRMRNDFNASQAERSEMLREMNALRDMALAQAKHDDDVLKKFIAMI